MELFWQMDFQVVVTRCRCLLTCRTVRIHLATTPLRSLEPQLRPGGLGLWTLEFRSPDGALLESTGYLGGRYRDDHDESCLTFTLS